MISIRSIAQAWCLAVATAYIGATSLKGWNTEVYWLAAAVFYVYTFANFMGRKSFWTPLFIPFGFLLCSPNVHSVPLMGIGIISYFYFGKQTYALRKIPLVKNISVALSWAMVNGVFHAESSLERTLAHFFIVLSLSLIIDYYQQDQDSGKLVTAPLVLGKWWTWIFVFALQGVAALYLPKPLWFTTLFAQWLFGVTRYDMLREIPYMLFCGGFYELNT